MIFKHPSQISTCDLVEPKSGVKKIIPNMKYIIDLIKSILFKGQFISIKLNITLLIAYCLT